MIRLHEMQKAFQNYLLNNKTTIHTAIKATPQVSVQQRLDIYLDAYHSRLQDCLTANFPMLSTYLGFEQFYLLAQNFIRTHPSTYRSVRWFGDCFADFLKYNGEECLAELAEFEWKMTLAFDAADDELIDVDSMAAIPAETWPSLRFVAHASVQRLDCHWNIIAIWQALITEQTPPKPKKYKAIHSVVIWRQNYINYFDSLTKAEAWAFDALISGMTFGELCEGLCDWFDEETVGMQAAFMLKKWIQAGFLSTIKM